MRECWGRRVGDLCSDCSKQRPALKAMGCCCIPCCVATTIFLYCRYLLVAKVALTINECLAVVLRWLELGSVWDIGAKIVSRLHSL